MYSVVVRWTSVGLGFGLGLGLAMAHGQVQGPNLALGKPVESSGANWGSFKPGAVTDGDPSTFTHPLNAAGTLGFFYEVDLGGSIHLERIVIRNRNDGCCPERLSGYGVEVYADAEGEPGPLRWRTVVREDRSNSGVGGEDLVTADQDPTGHFEGRFVRVVNTTGAAYSPQVAEIEIYGGTVPVIHAFTVDDDVLDAGQATRMRWSVGGATKVEIHPGVGVVTLAGGSVEVAPTETTEYRLVASNENGASTAGVRVGVGVTLDPPRLNEIAADNAGGLPDEDGDDSDWIELWNPNSYSYEMGGLYLSDDPSQLRQWQIPAIRLPPGGFLLIYASGKDRARPGSEWHTNFRLNADGDWIGLVDRDGQRVLDQIPETLTGPRRFPAQRAGAGYGRGRDGSLGFLRPPSPGTSNGVAFAGLVEPIRFSRHRGYVTTNFDVTLSCATEGAVIRYTLDRSEPTLSRGQTYAGPVPITRTTVLRAAAFRDGWAPTAVVTHTYVFPRDVVGASVMRKAITTNAVFGPQLEAGLRDLPSVVLLASSSINDTAESRTSFEWIDPGGGEGIHENCGARLYGGAFTDFAKKNFRLYFRSEFGASKLRHDLFEDRGLAWAPVREFDQLELRSGSHDMEMRGFYMSNLFTDDTLAEMGHLSPHTRFVHLFLNGNYWGVYQLRERWGAAMHARYLGGSRSQYESINGNWNVGGWAEPGTPYDGDGALWSRIKSLRGNYRSVKEWVDVPQYIDMMLVWMFGGCEDEYRCVGPNVAGVGMKFHINDADGWFCVPNYCAAGNRTERGAPGRAAGDGPGSLFSMLFKEGDPEYRMLLADRIQSALGKDGALSTANNLQRLDRRLQEFQRAFLLESARWNYLTPDAWSDRRDYVRSDWIPRRTQEVLGLFRSAGFLSRWAAPDLAAPAGRVASGFRVTFEGADAGIVTYTLDGSDPRLPGGGVSAKAREYRVGGAVETLIPLGARWRWFTDATGLGSSAIVEGHPQWSAAHWKHPSFADDAWSTGNAQLGYGEGDEATRLPFGGDAAAKWVTAYFRQAVLVQGTNPVLRSVLRIRRDDGVIVYLNGREIARSSMPTSEVGGQTLAVSPADDGQDLHEIEVPVAAVRLGTNVIAVELHQSSRSTSDASFDLEWIATRGGVAVGETPVLDRNTVVKARTRQGVEWSGLATAFFQVADSPLPVGSVAIVEMQYHPLGEDSGEYLVLRNVSDQAVNLRGARFTDGLAYAFRSDSDVPLAAGESLTLVRDLVRFRERHGSGVPVHGIYSGSLNNGGERLALVDSTGKEILAFEYRAQSPWPTEPDGSGSRLLLVEPELGLNSARAWRASLDTNGVPGVSDATNFRGDPEIDVDADGWSRIVEYALGTDDDSAASHPGPWHVGFRDPGWVVVNFGINGRADDARVEVDSSEDLRSWQPAEWLGARRLDDQRSEVTWGRPVHGDQTVFLRIRVRRR